TRNTPSRRTVCLVAETPTARWRTARLSGKGMRSNGFRLLSAGDKLRPDVSRSWIGADAGRCASLGGARRRAVHGGRRLPIGSVGADVRGLVGSVVRGDEGRGRVVRPMADIDRPARP